MMWVLQGRASTSSHGRLWRLGSGQCGGLGGVRPHYRTPWLALCLLPLCYSGARLVHLLANVETESA